MRQRTTWANAIYKPLSMWGFNMKTTAVNDDCSPVRFYGPASFNARHGYWEPCWGSEVFICKECGCVFDLDDGYKGSDSVCEECGINNEEVEDAI